MDEESPKPKKGKLRTGYSTGSCAAAATKAAVLALLGKVPVDQVEIFLPVGRSAVFSVAKCSIGEDEAICSVIKDGGDDPDVTHGAEIIATLCFSNAPGLSIRGGSGVGKITKPGLGLEVGEPAINPVPRQMITRAFQEACEIAGNRNGRGFELTISVPNGEEIAKKTLNTRLGIVGGISILGTTGLVIPYSTKAYRDSINQAIAVAKAVQMEKLVFTTGGRSEKFAQKIMPMKEEAFIQMGDFVGHALKQALKYGFEEVVICGMPGKISKIAQGLMQTHARHSTLDFGFMAMVGEQVKLPESLINEIRGANTARHVFEMLQEKGLTKFFTKICELASGHSMAHIQNRVRVGCILTDFDGKEVGRFIP